MLDVKLTHQLGQLALDVDFSAPAGVTVLFGRSGAGKTTVVNAVAGLLQPQTGKICLGSRVVLDTEAGIDTPPHRRRIGYIFQDARLFPHMSVSKNLLYGQRFKTRKRAVTTFDTVVEMLGLGALLKRHPANLSGGEKQRVAIGRALLSAPDMILADEPLAALDETRKAEILPYLERLRDEITLPILYVTHSVAEVARLATTVVVLQDGRCIRSGPADLVLADPTIMPTGVRAAGAILQATVQQHHTDGLSELNAGGLALFLPRVPHPPGHAVRVRISAHEVILSRQRPVGLSALNILPGRVTALRSGDGPGIMISLQTSAGALLARVTRRSAVALDLAIGTECHAIVKSVSIAPEDVGGTRTG
ncbi:molybdenum ABC transporter ATP-binding protein (plasmid) [Phaeobacter inhibens]|uniref:molybdenum ABC transporter ATP-binding protein n=1 Tax=Phaeobacter inhibens TaxID=221822 RepID=UPI0021A4EF59|nr:molybdenum ABC transporter ATP-binding protein [Phaeobacter inhibens]UWR66539.1 molybdenum ABC transporter ATP-binding protein [Phaeobacter inhibens]UWS02163.1 molybdenum ABC transporter ATP-binding protein [Phaeobacter inhibens]UWS06194.1 molybdenum ABC transporter ATP-binding protein [Phaeobacter inhibens]